MRFWYMHYQQNMFAAYIIHFCTVFVWLSTLLALKYFQTYILITLEFYMMLRSTVESLTFDCFEKVKMFSDFSRFWPKKDRRNFFESKLVLLPLNALIIFIFKLL